MLYYYKEKIIIMQNQAKEEEVMEFSVSAEKYFDSRFEK